MQLGWWELVRGMVVISYGLKTQGRNRERKGSKTHLDGTFWGRFLGEKTEITGGMVRH